MALRPEGGVAATEAVAMARVAVAMEAAVAPLQGKHLLWLVRRAVLS